VNPSCCSSNQAGIRWPTSHKAISVEKYWNATATPRSTRTSDVRRGTPSERTDSMLHERRGSTSTCPPTQASCKTGSHSLGGRWTLSTRKTNGYSVMLPIAIIASTSAKLAATPLRTAVELDAFTGLRRGELIGLQWEDVDFENLLVHVRRSVAMMVEGVPKTEASAKDLPLDAALAESMLKLKLASPYQQPTDWVFASAEMKGKQPWWPDTMWRRYGKPAVTAAKITKRVAFHTFRHTYTTLLTQNNEDVKVVQELLRHANSRITLDLYAQAGMAGKREAQRKVVEMVLKKGKAVA